MQADFSRSVDLIDKDEFMKAFIPIIVPELNDELTLSKIVSNQCVNMTLEQAINIARLSDCVDYCVMLAVSNYVNYVALGNSLYTKLKSSMYFSTTLSSEAVASLNTIISFVLKSTPSEQTAQCLFDVFMARRVFNEYSELISLLLVNVYCLRHRIGTVVGWDSFNNRVKIKLVEST